MVEAPEGEACHEGKGKTTQSCVITGQSSPSPSSELEESRWESATYWCTVRGRHLLVYSERAPPIGVQWESAIYWCTVREHHLLLAWSILPVFSSVQSLSRVRLFGTPWTAAPRASLSIINSGSLLKLMSIESVMLFIHLILCCPLLLPPSVFASNRDFSNEVAKVLELQFQHQSFQWIFRTDSL